MIRNKVYETVTHIFITIGGPQFKYIGASFLLSCVCIGVVRCS